jgi:ubiquinone/menaquinone biosynthesis C-methylase UbiE
VSFKWPNSFPRIPDDPWTRQPIEELARNYDTVENHGWYRNLDLTVEQIGDFIGEEDLLLDYSGGTGILANRLLSEVEARFNLLIVDASPKFLRLALEKLADDPRVAFRLIRYLREKRRLERVDEILDPALLERGFDGLTSTNAIHLYCGLPETLRSWRRILRPGARVFVQSGNIRNPEMPEGDWIIDETVEAIHRAAVDIVREGELATYREQIDDEPYMEAHDRLREKYFLPVRPLDHYLAELDTAGFSIASVDRRSIVADVEQWYEFLSVYHEGVLGWVGGAEKITGRPASPDAVEDRLELVRRAMSRVFGGDSFRASWTYITCEPVTS